MLADFTATLADDYPVSGSSVDDDDDHFSGPHCEYEGRKTDDERHGQMFKFFFAAAALFVMYRFNEVVKHFSAALLRVRIRTETYEKKNSEIVNCRSAMKYICGFSSDMSTIEFIQQLYYSLYLIDLSPRRVAAVVAGPN